MSLVTKIGLGYLALVVAFSAGLIAFGFRSLPPRAPDEMDARSPIEHEDFSDLIA